MNHHRIHAIGLCLLLVSGCSQAPAQPPTAPPNVTVSYPLQQQVSDYEDYTGRTAAVDSVEVRARVSGYLQKINFREGDLVAKDAVLYEIDPRPYQAALNQAQAQVKLQTAQLAYQEAVYQRDVRLANENAVSSQEFQQSKAQRDTTAAQLEAAKAATATAELSLGWTKVTAPIAGRISRTLVTVGNLVTADQTLLTTIVSFNPMYAYFDVDEPTVERVRELIRQRRFQSARQPGTRVPVFLGLAIEQGYPHEGFIDFINNQVDPATATLQLRGTFPNPMPPVGDPILLPGLFVRVRVSIGPPYQALLVNQRALQTDQNLKYVYVVNDQNQIVRHDVQVGTQQGNLQVIKKGLDPTDRVVILGVPHVRPGAVVKPTLVPMPTADSNQASAAP